MKAEINLITYTDSESGDQSYHIYRQWKLRSILSHIQTVKAEINLITYTDSESWDQSYHIYRQWKLRSILSHIQTVKAEINLITYTDSESWDQSYHIYRQWKLRSICADRAFVVFWYIDFSSRLCTFVFNQKVLIFFLFFYKNYVVVLILSTSPEHFLWVPQHMVSWRNKKNMWLSPLIWSYDWFCNWRGNALITLYGPYQVKRCLQTYAKYAESDHTEHGQIIIWAFALHSYILYIVSNDSFSGQWRPWSDCICTVWSGPTLSFAVHILPEGTFSLGGSSCLKPSLSMYLIRALSYGMIQIFLQNLVSQDNH